MFKFLDNKKESSIGVILLHGFGADMNDLFSMQSLFAEARVISYQAPVSLASMGYIGGYAWFSLDFTPFGIQYDIPEAVKAVEDLYEQISKQRKNFEKLIVCGFSQGSILTHALFLQYPDLLDGVACLSGRYSEFVFEDAKTEHIKNLPIFVSHGTADEVIPVQLGEQIIDFYKKINADLTSQIYDMGHEINYDCQQDLRNWFKSNFV